MKNIIDNFDYLNKIWECKSISETRKYLKKIQENFDHLEKNEQKKYVKKLSQLSLDFIIADSFDNGKNINIYHSEKAIRKLVLEQFPKINVKNFNNRINDLLSFFDSIIEKHSTKKITQKEIKSIFKVINQKFPDFQKILNNIIIDILIFNNTDKDINSGALPAKNFKKFKIICFCMKKDEDYLSGTVNPSYVFLHELGHILCWLMTNEERKVPENFLKKIEKYMIPIDPSNQDLLEVFADSFAMAIMHNTELNRYNPFHSLPKELFTDLEEYFKESIRVLI